MKNKLIIFDCFGVIFDEIAPVFFSRYLPGEKAAEIKEKIFVPADLGEIQYEEIFEKISEELNLPVEEIMKEWNSLVRLDEEMLPIIKKLGETADIALLSNAPLGFLENLIEKHKLAPLFDKIFISCNLKMAKPDPEIYRFCVSRFGKEYDEIYMIDDNIKILNPCPHLA